MKILHLYAAVFCLFLFLSCVENEIETFDVAIDIQPHGSASIEPEVYGPLCPGDSISITITPMKTISLTNGLERSLLLNPPLRFLERKTITSPPHL